MKSGILSEYTIKFMKELLIRKNTVTYSIGIITGFNYVGLFAGSSSTCYDIDVYDLKGQPCYDKYTDYH